MNKISIVIVSGLALLCSAPCWSAEAPFLLNSEQMESVTAGALGNFTFTFGRDGLLFNTKRNEVVTLQTQSGATLTSTIRANSFGYRAFTSSIKRSGGGIFTTITKN